MVVCKCHNFFLLWELILRQWFDFSREGGGQGEEIRPNKSSFLLLVPFPIWSLLFRRFSWNTYFLSKKTFSNESGAKNTLSILPLPKIPNVKKINVSDANAVIPQSFSSESFCISATIYDLLHLTFDANSRGKELLTNSRKWCHLFPQSSPISDKCSHSFGSLDHIALGLDLIKSPTHHNLICLTFCFLITICPQILKWQRIWQLVSSWQLY